MAIPSLNQRNKPTSWTSTSGQQSEGRTWSGEELIDKCKMLSRTILTWMQSRSLWKVSRSFSKIFDPGKHMALTTSTLGCWKNWLMRLPLFLPWSNMSSIKKGEQYDPANYRPVPLTRVCCKMLEHILTSTVKIHSECYQILCPQQHPFKRKRSCETQLLGYTDELFNSMAQEAEVQSYYTKAFEDLFWSINPITMWSEKS